ncbi:MULTISPECIES: cytochrome c oxidase subunit 3 family protein [Bosea]|uniref:cytochrome c oxidase subunit 3 family protein n=1 Tax=Bosea TaxID=85413 RepID=UPI00140EB425|nr:MULTISPECIES: cytochrome c oxidase subunit 3 family protein [Bosea]MCR4523480.1 cytochrome c oxidase subunit 3 family protein [Bosea sp. 47.2.35]MDR6830483.1 nitric oxide reductase NorE protein [Bosea robiniae]MDR6897238.1 nitric oxide reductase NorE protein [Bosea sp. BE109]MDR7140574.1 nitric oxide reductase NorE protein [Bosea sp. BE168]MDR7177271.1 nitric oxide reductase NorE protein [Bosea sp. BE271]
MNVALREGLDTTQPEAGSGIELLLWILIWSELAVFGALLGAFLLLGMLDPAALAAVRGELDLPLAGIATAILVSSGFFAARAASGWQPLGNLIAAALGGLIFCGLKIVAFTHELPALAAMEARLAELYMLIVGFHFAHVLFVAGLLLLVAWRPTPRHIAGVATIWHLIDLVWLLILPVVYLG